MSVEELVKRLRGVDHMSVEDCFLQSPLFGHAADKLEELAAEVERVRDGNRYAHLEQIAIKRANKAEAALAEKDKEIAALRKKAKDWSMEADKYKRALDRCLARNAGGNDA